MPKIYGYTNDRPTAGMLGESAYSKLENYFRDKKTLKEL